MISKSSKDAELRIFKRNFCEARNSCVMKQPQGVVRLIVRQQG